MTLLDFLEHLSWMMWIHVPGAWSMEIDQDFLLGGDTRTMRSEEEDAAADMRPAA